LKISARKVRGLALHYYLENIKYNSEKEKISARRLLKSKYGEDLVFWGGGVDTQQVLNSGTPEEVKTEVKENLKIFSSGGGYVFNPVHNIQGNTPIENIIAMYEALEEYNS